MWARVVALTAALGGGGFADAYNLANTTPNIITDIVIGGVLSATFVPVFVDHLTTRPADEAWEAISAVVTVTVTVLIVATVAFFVLTPVIIDLYTVTNHHADVHQQQQVAIFLLRWFVPQLTCYGLIALFTALLNTRGQVRRADVRPHRQQPGGHRRPGMVPRTRPPPEPGLDRRPPHRAGPARHRHHPRRGRPGCAPPPLARSGPISTSGSCWQPGHEAMRRITRLAGWTFGIVLSNQVALVVVLALADGAKVPGAVSAYTYAYTFFQLPYGVVAVSVMTAVTPSLSARWAQGDLAAFRHRMAFGLRGILAIIIPSAVGHGDPGPPAHRPRARPTEPRPSAEADATGATLAMFALGLPGFCTFLYMVRVLQAMQDTRTAFRIYLVENGINIVLGILLVGPLGVRGLALSVSIAYSVAAILALSVVRSPGGRPRRATISPSRSPGCSGPPR